MKKLMLTVFFALALGLSPTVAFAEAPKDAPKTKKVCVDTKDKNGAVKKECKDVKIHKKHEGTQVPDGKKK